MVYSNVSNISDLPNAIAFREPRFSVHIRVVLYAVVFFFSFLGNSIVIRAIRRISGRKPLGYILVTNLASAELGNTALFTFFAVYEELGRNWIFGLFLCKLIVSLQIVCFASVGYTLASIAVYRWVMIAAPLPSRSLSRIKTKLLIVATWIIGVAAAIPSLVTRNLEENKELGTTICQEVWSSPIHLHIYTIIYMTCVIFAPTVIIILAYAMIALKLREHIVNNKKKVEKQESDTLVTSVTDLKPIESRTMRLEKKEKPPHKLYALTLAVNAKKENKRKKKAPYCELQMKNSHQEEATKLTDGRSERKIIELECDLLKMIYIIVFISVICYLPVQILFILHEFALPMMQGWKYTKIVVHYSYWLTLLPSALHPLCYGTMSKFYAKMFSKIISCRHQ